MSMSELAPGEQLVWLDAIAPSNDAHCRIWLIRLVHDGKLLGRRPATAALRAGQHFYLRVVTGHNGHITSLTYSVGDRVGKFMGPLHQKSQSFRLDVAWPDVSFTTAVQYMATGVFILKATGEG
jgi:hypothetical protein